MKHRMESPVMLQTAYLADPCRIPLALLSTTEPWNQQCFPPKEFWFGGGTKQSTECGESSLPSDPRQWTRQDVACWLRHVTTRHHLPEVQLDRFLMNGKALCLMTIDMFVQRVPLGGEAVVQGLSTATQQRFVQLICQTPNYSEENPFSRITPIDP